MNAGLPAEPSSPTGADFVGASAWRVLRDGGGLGPLYLVERVDDAVLAVIRLYPVEAATRERASSALSSGPALPVDQGHTRDGDLWIALRVELDAETTERLRRGTFLPQDEARVVEPYAAVFEALYRRVRGVVADLLPTPMGLGRLRSRVVGGYEWRILRPLGQGGVGSVYLAERAGDGWLAAIKFYARISAAREEAIREAAAMRVRDAATIEVRDAGLTADGEVWMAVDFVRGEDLRTRLERGPVPVAEAAAILVQLFRVLDVLHRAGVAHGDIKPENLLIEPGGRLRLVDFGRARLHHLYGADGTFPGTVPYMHPSLFRGGAPEPKTDTFAAWVVLYELVLGQRPYYGQELRSAASGTLPRPARRLPDPALQVLVWAGLDGTLRTARPSWLALSRFQRGRTDLPRVRSMQPPPDPRDVAWLWEHGRAGRSATVVGMADDTRAVLEEVHRRALREGGYVLWVRADWGHPGTPLSGALGLAQYAVDAFDVATLARIGEELGPLGGVLAQRVPSVRTWAPRAPRDVEAGPENVPLALRALLAAAPRGLFLLVDRLDQLDGASRRFLGSLALSGEVPVLASTGPRGTHGLPHEREVSHRSHSLEPGQPGEPAHEAVLARASVLELPFGEQLAAATGLPMDQVEEAALECEARGAARWNGHEVLPRALNVAGDEEAQAWLRDAGRRLRDDPLLAASYARRAGDLERLAEVVEGAVHEALLRDPEEALRLLDEDPRARTPERILRHFHVAMLARRVPRAEGLLGELRAAPGVGEGDLAEAEGELAFRTGRVQPAIDAYRRAAAALGRGLGRGVWLVWEVVRAFWRVRSGRRLPPRADPRLGRILERLHDLQFTHDHGTMVRVHELWLEAAPDHPRARAMEMVWQTALGQHDRARLLEEALLHDIDEGADPVGYALVLLHRAIARTWLGRTVDAMADALDASAILLRSGDCYLAALGNTTVTVCAIHLGEPDRLANSNRRTARLAEVMGDARAAAWVQGGIAAWHWLVGDDDAALRVGRQWAEDARAREDSSEAAARRFLAELYAHRGDWADALREAERARVLIGKYRLLMDIYASWVIPALAADARARLEGARGLGAWGRWRAERGLATLLRLSPRWMPRALVARGWMALAAGRKDQARELFHLAATDAHQRAQHHDEWLALDARVRALGDEDAARDALQLARRTHLKQGAGDGS